MPRNYRRRRPLPIAADRWTELEPGWAIAEAEGRIYVNGPAGEVWHVPADSAGPNGELPRERATAFLAGRLGQSGRPRRVTFDQVNRAILSLEDPRPSPLAVAVEIDPISPPDPESIRLAVLDRLGRTWPEFLDGSEAIARTIAGHEAAG
jgi:hypothetical protein